MKKALGIFGLTSMLAAGITLSTGQREQLLEEQLLEERTEGVEIVDGAEGPIAVAYGPGLVVAGDGYSKNAVNGLYQQLRGKDLFVALDKDKLYMASDDMEFIHRRDAPKLEGWGCGTTIIPKEELQLEGMTFYDYDGNGTIDGWKVSAGLSCTADEIREAAANAKEALGVDLVKKVYLSR